MKGRVRKFQVDENLVGFSGQIAALLGWPGRLVPWNTGRIGADIRVAAAKSAKGTDRLFHFAFIA